MPNRLSALACAVLLVASGCGTVSNLNEGKHAPGGPPRCKPFGGVRGDLEAATEIGPESGGIIGILVLVDLPFSLVGDVFTLPWTIKAVRMRKAWPTGASTYAPGP